VTWALDAVVALLGFDAELVVNADGGPAAVRAQAAYLLGSTPTEGIMNDQTAPRSNIRLI
jgi:hypothetical protein